jgi:hypothetical protein
MMALVDVLDYYPHKMHLNKKLLIISAEEIAQSVFFY